MARLAIVHLFWTLPPDASDPVEASVVLEILSVPQVASTYFWALQATFTDAQRNDGGAAHLGLQWYPKHPRSRAVNWGGYPPANENWKKTLEGSRSRLRSHTHDPNTRNFAWEPGVPYELRIAPAPRAGHGWRGTVTDLQTGKLTTVRDLHAPGNRLTGLCVWTEWFCGCDDPTVAVRWSQFRVRTADGADHWPTSVKVNHPAGNCANVSHLVEQTVPELVVQQVMNTERLVPHGTILPVRPDWGGPAPVQ